ncbi:breast cancer metastasis-suppressor 1-like protein-A isoform 2-T2 [Salvelinus alpinus]|uniref:breast cancer metastasis-suppressor 1-like protein-A isoform X2 n=1 Tax=Salvelinus sp. IW2-2015 TaxID=2691554 RepID=UPI000CDFC777|nr:breast cancer metastasis-suppressor 1-like protein-A isoform X2 [Salvelinus alpinus]
MMGIARVVQGEVESGGCETPGVDCRQGFGVPGPLENLQENMQIRTKVGIYWGLCVESVKNKYDCEIQAVFQHWECHNNHDEV